MIRQALLIAAFTTIISNSSPAQTVLDETKTSVQSPDNNITVQFYQKQFEPGKREMYYQLSYKNKPVISESALDLQLDNNLSERAMALKVDKRANWCENLKVTGIHPASKDTTWQPVYGEQSQIRDRYNAVTIELVKDDNPIYMMNVEIRVYNEGAAIRYFFPENPKGTYYRIMQENTAFSLPEGTLAWHASWAQAPYKIFALNNWPDESERPLTLQLPGGLYACLAEAGCTDYARTKYKVNPANPNTILTSMYTPADLISPVGTPWRVIMVAEKPGDLITNNNLIVNLNEPSKNQRPRLDPTRQDHAGDDANNSRTKCIAGGVLLRSRY